MDDRIDALCHLQAPGGAFLSTVQLAHGPMEDRNCFVTGLVLRETAGIESSPALDEARRRACGYLLRSKYPVYPHLWSFYPHRAHPPFMRQALYADADDTCVIALELVRAGHLPREALRYIAEEYLTFYRATGDLKHHRLAPWQPEGVFLTWFTTAAVENPIDCCVNTNVVGMLAAAGLTDHQGYSPACAMINGAAAEAAAHPERGREFTPYYPSLAEWYHALVHAVASGASALLPAREALRAAPAVQAELDRVTPLCSDVGGSIRWTAEVLWLARRLRKDLIGGGGRWPEL